MRRGLRGVGSKDAARDHDGDRQVGQKLRVARRVVCALLGNAAQDNAAAPC